MCRSISAYSRKISETREGKESWSDDKKLILFAVNWVQDDDAAELRIERLCENRIEISVASGNDSNPLN